MLTLNNLISNNLDFGRRKQRLSDESIDRCYLAKHIPTDETCIRDKPQNQIELKFKTCNKNVICS